MVDGVEPSLRDGDITSISDELGELFVGHLRRVDPKGRDINVPHWTFLGKVVLRAHLKRATRNQNSARIRWRLKAT